MPDFITLDTRPGSTAASPKFIKDSTSVPTVFALSRARKYLDQNRDHDEEMRSSQAKIEEYKKTIATLNNDLEAKEQAISHLTAQLEEYKNQVKEKEKGMQELSIQAHRLRKQMEETQQRGPQRPQVSEDPFSKKAKFGFLKK